MAADNCTLHATYQNRAKPPLMVAIWYEARKSPLYAITFFRKKALFKSIFYYRLPDMALGISFNFL